jgi:very-short-patch-repair endonuclease
MKLNTSRENQSLLLQRRHKLVSTATEAEIYVKQLLETLGVEFCFQKGFFNQNTHYIVDFYLKKNKRLCLEIDGSHHFFEPQLTYDLKRDRFLSEVRGFRVKRISNEVALGLNEDSLLKLIS